MAVGATAPPELSALRDRVGEITDLQAAGGLLHWDQNTFMPPGGADGRAEQMATLERLAHARLVDGELTRLLDVLEPWAESQDPDGDEARLVRAVRRDHEKATRVPEALAVEMAREAARGYGAWLEARATGDFKRFRDPMARQVELRREYAACFPDAAHPYDVLLDDFEPGMTTAEVRGLFDPLVEGLKPLVEAAADDDAEPLGGLFSGSFPVDRQHDALVALLSPLGFEAEHWRLDASPHPFAFSPGPGDVRLTTRYRDDDLAFSLYSALHEYGHGLYDLNLAPSLQRTPLYECASLGVHESQSRLWENFVGRSRPFCAWMLPMLRERFPDAFGPVDADALYRGVNAVRRSLIRTESDETTYNLHIVLRFELELALLEDRLQADDLPQAWADGMQRLLGVEVPSDAEGVLQDVHWAQGAFGYFPTYTLGNLIAAQLWRQLRTDVADVDELIARGEFQPLRDWLRENVHRHGRKYTQRELLRRATGQELAVEPFLDYLGAKLADAGVITPAR